MDRQRRLRLPEPLVERDGRLPVSRDRLQNERAADRENAPFEESHDFPSPREPRRVRRHCHLDVVGEHPRELMHVRPLERPNVST